MIERFKEEKIAPLCKYMLPCGFCDLKKQECNADLQDFIIDMEKGQRLIPTGPAIYTHLGMENEKND